MEDNVLKMVGSSMRLRGFAVLRTLKLPSEFQVEVIRHRQEEFVRRAAVAPREIKRPGSGNLNRVYIPMETRSYGSGQGNYTVGRTEFWTYGRRAWKGSRRVAYWAPVPVADVNYQFRVRNRLTGQVHRFPRAWGKTSLAFRESLVCVLRGRVGCSNTCTRCKAFGYRATRVGPLNHPRDNKKVLHSTSEVEKSDRRVAAEAQSPLRGQARGLRPGGVVPHAAVKGKPLSSVCFQGDLLTVGVALVVGFVWWQVRQG